MKTILLIGLGRFGQHMAQKFHEMDHEVLAIDVDETAVNATLPYVTNAQIADCTKPGFIVSLGVTDFDLCIVAVGSDFRSSLEITALLKDNGAPFVVSRASNEFHARFLLRNGADKVVYPEKHTAEWAAVCYSNDTVFDYMPLTKDYSIYEAAVPASWVGKTVTQLNVRQRTKLNVLATKRGESLTPITTGEHVFRSDETVLVMGDNKDLNLFLQRR